MSAKFFRKVFPSAFGKSSIKSANATEDGRGQHPWSFKLDLSTIECKASMDYIDLLSLALSWTLVWIPLSLNIAAHLLGSEMRSTCQTSRRSRLLE
ncbi:hypothetical protein AVEN_267282-1 [Araneus ventricosus]|uniref:Uncharacterized protein n=1 Tax=Araneus ventricosus TaxID=182803 RepID=A0A4Y2RET4_ARAVE|nr:hypothetical protein AVEN_267282-1 [Araneus ventricosus]